VRPEGSARRPIRLVALAGYQTALLAEGARRRNLDGTEAGEVTPDQRELARERLTQMKAAKQGRDGK
jgi:sRNA-binding protein